MYTGSGPLHHTCRLQLSFNSLDWQRGWLVFQSDVKNIFNNLVAPRTHSRSLQGNKAVRNLRQTITKL
jgi:hypothetical protein